MKLRPGKIGLYDPAYEHDACGVGFIAQVRGERSHRLMQQAAHMLTQMDHRGACGCEPNTGDGAGMLTALPHALLRRVAADEFGAELGAPGTFSAGVFFLPQDDAERDLCRRIVEKIVAERGQDLIGWRKVPTRPDVADIGATALDSMPIIEQLFIRAADGLDQDAFERELYLIRKQATIRLRGNEALAEAQMFYVCSLSTRVIIYKGMLTSGQLVPFFPDLAASDYESHLAMVHSRFATNTFPSWDRAQPNRFMSHNGEINTLRGNMNWMHAREGVLRSDLFGDDLPIAFPVVEPDCSDSGSFDNVLEFLLLTGRTLQEAVMMMIPEAWQNDPHMDAEKRAFYDYHSCLMEPWDGPASIAFTDGRYIGAVLDRNGLRPSRYYVTDDDLVIMASEAGVVPVEPERVLRKGRLKPGRMFLVDFDLGRIVADEELKSGIASQRPYAEWLERRTDLADLVAHAQNKGNTGNGNAPANQAAMDDDTLTRSLQAFGYTGETMRFMLRPLIEEQRDPIGSMGNDTALAFLSDQDRPVYDYFKQLFAQVTNPAIDSIREEVVMSVDCTIGPERNLLETTADHCLRVRLPHPILSNREFAALADAGDAGFACRTLDATWPLEEGAAGLGNALDRLCREAEQAVDDGCAFVALSDRAAGPDRVPVPTLLACGAVHHHLLRTIKRTRVGLLLETGEAREVHHHCLLVGYGADAINPYLTFEALWQARRQGRLPAAADDQAVVDRYRKGVRKGMLKVMAKMGISTLQSYKGAQIFEAVGLSTEVIDRCFAGTASRIEGAGLERLAKDALKRHARGFPSDERDRVAGLANPGDYHWRAGGERHMWNPQMISRLQNAARTNSTEAYESFARLANEDTTRACSLRGLLQFRTDLEPLPLEAVEPASEIVKRFCTGAMSFGSISAESHETLAIAMNRLGGKSNTGEGGEDPARFTPDANGDLRRSAIKQVASGRFGVTSWYLTNSDELQIKIAQGAKPGEGGELPGHKVDEIIARTRYSTPGVGLISPPPHHDIYSIEDLKQLIHDLKNSNPGSRISVKLVSEVGVGTVAAGVAKAHADHILISGHDGGTGASPLTSIKHAGLPWELGIAETHQTLVLSDLRSRVILQTDGQLKTGRDVAVACMLGAEEFGFSTAPLITIGCIMMRKCHLNTCPVGIATQDPELRAKFEGTPEEVVNYLFLVAEEARRIMAGLGVATIRDLVGRTDLFRPDLAVQSEKTEGLDLSAVLQPALRRHERVEVTKTIEQDHALEHALDNELIERARPALERGVRVRIKLPIENTQRTVGTMLSHELMKARGEHGLADDTIHISLTGSAGQSLGAFLAPGITVELEGDGNDYVGKGLSGGRLILYPPRRSRFVAEDNVLIGNVALYGATGGEAFFRGRAAERFCVRNSGARAVIEGIGDHGCEYMTGGRAVILGPTGRNFAAGMSGGVAWVLDPRSELDHNCNFEMVGLEPVGHEYEAELRELVARHARFTGSTVARRLLERWNEALRQFIQVMPHDYRRVLEAQREPQTEVQTEQKAEAAA
ncbi:MAG: glutamate synthase large subunit [Acidobacteria bacterium]|nr:glutamate synthase large subunit [Acidobacteriota bacterium]